MMLPVHSQIISRGEVKTLINTNGDTLVVMNLEDAKVILSDLLEYEIVDSLLTVYKEKDSLYTNTITLQKDIIVKLTQKSENQSVQISNFQTILDNKDQELLLNDDIIKQQKKEIRKQKFFKIVGFAGSIILPIVTLLALL
jgi:ABC-type antimicrobial peptide transport system permease subunit